MTKRNKQNEDYTKVGHNYKGIFYNEEEPEERYFEYGAHFRYADLCRRLERIKRSQEISAQIILPSKPIKESSRNHNNDKLPEAQAAHSNININMNNFFITDHGKSRNHTKSRNTQINENYSLQIQLDTALKASLKIQEEAETIEKRQSSIKINRKPIQNKVINLVSHPYKGPIGRLNSNEHRKFSNIGTNKPSKELKLTKVITITKGE